MVRIIYDEHKRHGNLAKHGLDFGDLTLEFFEMTTIYPAKARRLLAIGPWRDSRMIAVVFVPLGAEAISVVSMRMASRSERNRHNGQVRPDR